MKYIIIFVFQFCLLYGEIDFDKINSIFNDANKLYEEGDYFEANNLYKNIVSSNIISKDLYYNLGLSYAKIGSNGYAILWYERALNISPFDKEIKNNIDLFNQNSFSNPFENKSTLIIISILFILPAIISYNIINSNYLIVVERSNLYKGESERADIISIINEGEKFRILKEYSNWYYVKSHSFSKGWINKSFVEKI